MFDKISPNLENSENSEKNIFNNYARYEKSLGSEWKQKRFHHLVRLGGDIIKSGLADYSKPTIVGGLILYKQQEQGAVMEGAKESHQPILGY